MGQADIINQEIVSIHNINWMGMNNCFPMEKIQTLSKILQYVRLTLYCSTSHPSNLNGPGSQPQYNLPPTHRKKTPTISTPDHTLPNIT